MTGGGRMSTPTSQQLWVAAPVIWREAAGLWDSDRTTPYQRVVGHGGRLGALLDAIPREYRSRFDDGTPRVRIAEGYLVELAAGRRDNDRAMERWAELARTWDPRFYSPLQQYARETGQEEQRLLVDAIPEWVGPWGRDATIARWLVLTAGPEWQAAARAKEATR